MNLRDISIKGKLTLIIMAASTVALLLVSAGFVTCELVTFRKTLIRDLTTLADLLANQSTAALSFDKKEDAEEILSSLRANKRIVAAGIYKGRRLFAQYDANPREGDVLPSLPELNTARFQRNRLVLFRQINLAGEPIGTIYLKSDLSEINQRLQLYAGIILLFMLASLLVTFVLSSLLQRIISRPIFQLAQSARTVSLDKNYSVRAQKLANDELGQLTDGFNEMLTQIQQQDQALQSANDRLEKRVHERTQDLQAEILVRQRAEAGLQEQLTRISLLNQITQIISERQDLESILQVVLRQLEDRLTVELGIVSLFDPAADTLNISALRLKNPLLAGRLDLHAGTVLPLAQTGLASCKKGETVYAPDTLQTRADLTDKLAQASLRSMAAVPLMVDNKLFGVLIVARFKTEGFTSGECEFLRTLSEHVALAAHQAQLHSELEKAYNELRQTQQAVMQQERLKALGQMASGIAHDINNALSPVVGFADLVLRGETTLSDNAKKYLQYIKTAGEDIAHIVVRLREFYRRRDQRESGRPLNINKLTQQVIDMTRPRWRDIPQGRGIMVELETDLDPTVPDLVGIESEVREALTNIILNAVDAVPNGGAIIVRTRPCGWEFAHGARIPTHVVLEVVDTGIGMDENTRRHCLEPFFSTKGKRGTGLGLAMVYGVMERHEGKIEIHSELGKGTTVRLVFPVRKTEQTGVLDQDKSHFAQQLEILCIDDEPLLRELLKELLEHDGHHVEVSDGGKAGLEAFAAARQRGRPFDVVITDLGMPYVDGRQVAKTLKQQSPATPVVLLTGWGAFMKEDGQLPAQVDGVLSKPPRARELRETILRVTQKQKAEVFAVQS